MGRDPPWVETPQWVTNTNIAKVLPDIVKYIRARPGSLQDDEADLVGGLIHCGTPRGRKVAAQPRIRQTCHGRETRKNYRSKITGR